MAKKFLYSLFIIFALLFSKSLLACNGVVYTMNQVGNTVTFTASVPAGYVINSYLWNFGDGNVSPLPNPTHTYASPGVYTACMVLSGIDPNNTPFQCTWCDSVLIANNAPCNASFISTVSGNLAAFTNTATGPGAITGYAWSFGDGGTSALPNPTHTYLNSGWYNVCLTITGIDNGQTYTCDWCDSVYVQVPGGNPCNGVSYTITQLGNAVTFNAAVPAGYVINSYYWNFGDGGNSNLANPTHTYANFGWYNACMTISGTTPNNGSFQCTFCDSINIGNNAPCNASFISTTSGLTAAFTNTATGPGAITGYAWTFGDGGTSALPNPTHTYANTGWYNVCLTITGIVNGQTYICDWCDSVYVQGPGGNPCNGVSYTTTQIGNAVTFNAVVPAGYVINTYSWTFGDGGISNLANPTHTYSNFGWYNACVVVSGFVNNTPFVCTYCDSIFIPNNAPCNASFISTTSGLTAAFTNTAAGPGAITGYAWTFGDGGTSALPNPTHTYANTGWYNVCLTITGIYNGQTYTCDWCDSVYVQGPAGNPCNGVSFATTQLGNAVTFNAVAPAGYVINTYFWTFGDGGNSNTANPTHTYANNGWYNVCITISGTTPNNLIFQCTYCDSIYVGNNAPCNASFTYTTSGLTAAFTNTATGPGAITGYAWTFGDGGTSALPNPTHTYANTGWYNVCLTITGIDNGQTYTCDWCDSIFVQAPGGNPCNGVSYTTTQIGNAVTFNAVVPAGYVINTYSWTFGDGGISNLANPTHTYSNFGWYNACVVISGFVNNTPFVCTYCDSLFIPNNAPCNASFISTTSGLTAAFTNTATGPGAITGYAWTFGDGGTSALPNPTHTYANTGWYNVCLTITGIYNGQTYTCDWCDSVYVQGPAGNPCNGVSFATTQLGNAVTFNAVAPAGYVINTYFWTFGDGGNSNLANPTHTYANTGWYNVCITISGTTPNNLIFQCTYCDSIYVGNNAPCNASFTYTTSGLTAAFTNTATGPGAITGYAWTFGDGGTSALPNPTHTYLNTGWYNVCLTITGIDNGQTYTCDWCDSIFVQAPGGNPCNGVSYTTTQIGNAVTFNAVVPAGYVINTYFWTFGDGGNSNLANPTHTYANFGWYNACMTISGTTPNNGSFQCTFCDSIFIGNNAPCNASFTYTTSGLTAAFTNTATGPGAITTYAWTFGDGGTSALPNPTHTYLNTGWYNVCLTITGINNGQTYTCDWCDSIFVQGAGNPCNGVYFNTTQVGNTATFNAVVPAGYVINTYSWTFGDGGNSNLANPTHTYAASGFYNVCMVISGIANNTPFQCSVCDSIQVVVSGINEVDVNNVLHVYPNPATNYLEINIPSRNNYLLKLYDVAGKLLDERRINDSRDKYSLNTEGLSKGMYFIQLISDNKKYQTNFVKQ